MSGELNPQEFRELVVDAYLTDPIPPITCMTDKALLRLEELLRQRYDAQRKKAAAVMPQEAATREPVPMVLHCPKCGMQHIDGEEWEDDPHDIEQGQIRTWKNEPHRSHLCHGCGTIWRPADVPTTGVKAISTKGKADTWAPGQATQQAAGEPRCSTCGVTMDEPHHPACGAVTAAIIGLSTMAAQDKEARRRELAEKIRETLRGVFTRPAPGGPEGVVLVPLTDREMDAAIDKAKAETMYGTHHSGYWRDIGRGVLAAAQAKGGAA